MPERYYERYKQSLVNHLNRLTPIAQDEPISLKDLPSLPVRLRRIKIQDGEEVTLDQPPAFADAHEGMKVWDMLLDHPRIVVLGERGSGKSVMLRYLTATFAGNRVSPELVTKLTLLRQETPASFLMPFYIPLGELAAQKDPLPRYLEKVCAEHGFPRAARFVRQRLENGECLLLFDGLENVPAERQSWVIEQINNLSRDFGMRNQFIVTADLAGYRHALHGFATLQLLGLSDEGIKEFIAQRFKDQPEQIHGLLSLLEWTPRLNSLAANPFSLAAITAAYSKNQHTQPVRANTIYEQCTRQLLEDAMARSRYTDPKLSSLDGLLRLLQQLAYELHINRKTSLSEEALTAFFARALAVPPDSETLRYLGQILYRSRLLIRRSRNTFGFGHIAFQEYLTAKELCARGELDKVLDFIGDPWWQETIILISGLVDSQEFIKKVADSHTGSEHAIFVAAHCLSEAELPGSDGIEAALRKGLFFTLSRLFYEEEPTRWRLASLAIASMEHKSLSEAFTKLLKDEDENVRERAALALGRLKPEWALAPLIEALDDPDERVRAKAAWALGCLNAANATSRLIDKLGDDAPSVPQAAAEALGAFGQPAVRDLVLSLRKEKAQVREWAARALVLVGEPAVAPLIEVVSGVKWGKEARKQAMFALGEIGSERTIDPLIRLLYEPDADLGLAAARALGRIGHPATWPLINAVAERISGVDVMPQVVEALVSIGEPAVGDLIQALGDTRPEIREAAERSLIGIRTPAIRHIIEALPKMQLTVQRRLARILGQIGDETAVETLIKLLEDADPGVQVRIVQALGRIKDRRAVDPLIGLMQREGADETVRRTAVRALGDIGDAAAVEPLVAALADSLLRGVAAPALRAIGAPAVERLIQLVYDTQDKDIHDRALQVLGEVGSSVSMNEPSPFGLARTFHHLMTLERDAYTPDEPLQRSQGIRWWPKGEELNRAFETAKAVGDIQSLEDAPQYGKLLAWVREEREWFRPPLRDILRGLGDITENVKLYLAKRHIGGQEALLSSVDKINDLQLIIDSKLQDFEKSVFRPVVAHWDYLLNETIRQTRGRAMLEFEVAAEQILLDPAATTTPVTFALSNMGDSVARNISVTLTPSHFYAVRVVGDATQLLDPLGSGMRREIEFTLDLQGDREASLTLEAVYDDDEGERHRVPFAARIRFGTIGKYVPIPASPYIAGKPIQTSEMFFGRQDTLDWVTNNLGGAYQQNVLVIYGERRIGKTSILYRLEASPPTPRHICILFNLELAAPRSVGKFLYDMAYEIYRGLRKRNILIPKPTMQEYEQDAEDRFRQFCEDLEGYIGDQIVVLMVDEFGILLEKVHKGELPQDTLNYVRGIIQHVKNLTFIFVGAHLVRKELQDQNSILFNMAKVLKLGYLAPNEAEQLIRKPVAGYLDYADPVVGKIRATTACHPYFIQYICDELVRLAQRQKKNYIGPADLEVVLHKTMEDTSGNIRNSIWIYLSSYEQRALAALAEVTTEQIIYVLPDRLTEVLTRHDLGIPKLALLDALRELCERDLVMETRIGQRLAYGFKMGLIRLWLRQSEMLIRLKEERSA